MKKIKLVTHSGKFHADDAFATAVLVLLFEKTGQKYEIIRSRDQKDIELADIVYDNGVEYDPGRQIFDHHQEGGAGKRQNGVPYAAFGLIWKHYGQDLIKNYFSSYNFDENKVVKIFEIIDIELVQPIDAADTGYEDYKSNKHSDLRTYLLDSVAGAFNPTNEEGYKKSSDLFMSLVEITKQILERELIKAKNKIDGWEKVEKIYNETEDKRIIVLDSGYNWKEILTLKPEPLYVVFPTIDDDGYITQAVTKALVGYETRRPFPKNWRGKVNSELEKESGVVGAKFCHLAGFLCVAKSREGAIDLAKKSCG